MDLRFEGGFGQARGVADLVLVPGAGAPILVAVERLGGGLRSYDITDFSEQNYRPHQGANLTTGVVVPLGGDSGRLLLAGSDLSRLDSHLISSSGAIAAQTSWNLPDLPEGAALSTLTSLTSQGQMLVYGVADGVLRGWQVSADGEVSARTRGGDADDYQKPGISALTTVWAGGQPVLLAADGESGGLLSYRINSSSGALGMTDQLGVAEGLGVATPNIVEGFTAYGQAWVVLGAAGSSSLSLVSVSSGGALTLRDHLVDTRGSRFGGLSAVEVVEVEGHVFVLAAGGDGGVELLRVLPTGQMVYAARLTGGLAQGLHNVTDIETYVAADQLQIFVSSETGLTADGEGIAHLALDLGGLGMVATASGAGQVGTAGDDLLIGNDSATMIQGGAGDDMLVMGAAGDRLEGGAGADVFVAQPDIENRVVIADFEPGQDQLDLTLLTGLRSITQLQVEDRHNGIELHWQGLELRVESADGNRLSVADIWPLGWQRPDRLPLGETLPLGEDDPSEYSMHLVGDAGRQTLWGGVGHDTLEGLGGDDILLGGQGDDVLLGGTGNDSLDGGADDDRLRGGSDADTMRGNDGSDTLLGDSGDDRLIGNNGDDALYGWTGSDALYGGAGDDRLYGDAGDDRLRGDGGNDRLIGGIGADTLLGDLGRDTLTGGSDADVFVFDLRHGEDQITDFGQGQDLLDLRSLNLSFQDLDIYEEEEQLRLGTGEGSIVLIGVTGDGLSQADFLF